MSGYLKGLLDRLDSPPMAVTAGLSAVACVVVVTTISRSIMRSRKRNAITEDFEKVAAKVGEPSSSRSAYDFIIVGGGTAGCVLASRLSENPNFNVLLLEGGGSSLNLLPSQIPVAFSELFHTEYDYDLWTTEQHHADGKKRYWPRGKMLGGCSSLNAMICHHGAPSDYDEWARIGGKGAEGWSYDHFKNYFLKFENFVPHSDYPNVDATLRSTSGPVQVGLFGNFTNFAAKFLTACANVGIPPVHDLNTFRGSIGVCKPITYIDQRGVRVTTESAYLTKDVLARPNLTILTYAQVTKVLFGSTKDETRAVGVELVDSRKGIDGQRFTVKCKKEVILSAGAIHSPHLLLLSGIGDSTELSSHMIEVVEDLPGVGKHLMDHPVVTIQIRTKEGETLNHLNKRHGDGPLKPLRDLLRWKMGSRGPLCSSVAETVAFLRSTDPKIFPPSVYRDALADTTSGPGAPDMELVGVPMGFIEHGHGVVPPGDVGCFGAVCLRPTSLGRILLKSSDPFDQLYIDPEYLSTDHDMTLLTRGLHLLLRLTQTEPISSLIGHNETDSRLDHHWNLDMNPSQQHTANPNHYSNHYMNTLSKLQTEVKRRTETLYHPSCTARMAPREEGGVVDPSLRVYGVKGLRVCDTSVFPTIPAGHTSAPVIATAEKAADIIKDAYAYAY